MSSSSSSRSFPSLSEIASRYWNTPSHHILCLFHLQFTSFQIFWHCSFSSFLVSPFLLFSLSFLVPLLSLQNVMINHRSLFFLFFSAMSEMHRLYLCSHSLFCPDLSLLLLDATYTLRLPVIFLPVSYLVHHCFIKLSFYLDRNLLFPVIYVKKGKYMLRYLI